MTRYAYVDEEIVPVSEATVSVEDRGFLFGDGVYDVVRLFEGSYFRLDRHLERLVGNAGHLEMTGLPGADRLREIADELRRRSDVDDGMLYLQITRGSGPRQSSYPDKADPTVVVYIDEMRRGAEQFRESGAEAMIVPEIRWRRCDIKSVNLLPKVTMKQRASEQGCYEALFADEDGTIWEGTSTNFFVVQQGVVRTTDHDERVLPGLTRREIVEIAAEESIPVELARVSLEDLRRADEAFLSGTLTEVLGVTRVEGEEVGDGRVGPITRQLQARLRERMTAGG
jgi:D-alanine transaminase